MGEGLDISTLLRLAADGELTPEQAERLEAHLTAHPEDRASVAFEQSLRRACVRHMRSAAAPAGLKERIQAALREQEAEEAAVVRSEHDGVVARVAPGEVVVRTRRISWTNRVLNAAAVIVVAGLAVLFLRAALSQDVTSAVAGFLPAEHEACAIDPERLMRRARAVPDLSEVPAAFQPLLGVSPSIPDIEALGYRFTGAGPCAVPGGDSVHLMFEAVKERRPEGCALRPLSLFIQRTDRFAVEPGQTYTMDTDDAKMTIYAWASDGLVYYLVADSKGQCNEVMKAIPLRTPALKLQPAR